MIIKIGVASNEEIKKRTLAIARGELKPADDEPKIWFNSLESVARILNRANRELLAEIATHEPPSLKELAKRVGRHESNLSRTLKTMENYDLVVLVRENGRLKPRTKITGVDINLVWGQSA